MMSGGLVHDDRPGRVGDATAGQAFVCKYVGSPASANTSRAASSRSSSRRAPRSGLLQRRAGPFLRPGPPDGREHRPGERYTGSATCPEGQTPPETDSVSPLYPTATEPTCDTDGHLVVPSQPDGVVVSGGGANGAGPGVYTFTFAPETGFAFPQGTDTSEVRHGPGRDGSCPVVTPGHARVPDVHGAVVHRGRHPRRPCAAAGVVVSAVAPTGAGPGSYTFTFAPAPTDVFTNGAATSTTVTVLDQGDRGTCAPPLNADAGRSERAVDHPAELHRGSAPCVAPAAQNGVTVVRTELGNGSARFDSTPAVGLRLRRRPDGLLDRDGAPEAHRCAAAARSRAPTRARTSRRRWSRRPMVKTPERRRARRRSRRREGHPGGGSDGGGHHRQRTRAERGRGRSRRAADRRPRAGRSGAPRRRAAAVHGDRLVRSRHP